MVKAAWFFLGAAGLAFRALYEFFFENRDSLPWLPMGGALVFGALGAYHVWRAYRDEPKSPDPES